jgi:hypothetical protein
MPKIFVRSHVGADGVLHLDIPTTMKDEDVEVTVTLKPVVDQPQKTPEELGWSPGFFEETAGCLADDPIVREPQGEPQERDWDAFNDLPD